MSRMFVKGEQCGGCRADANVGHAPKNSAPYLACLADVVVLGYAEQIGTLCPFHREKFETFERIHREVRALAGVVEATELRCLLCRRPAVWTEAAFSGGPRPPRNLCAVCAPTYAESDLGCTLRLIATAECPVCRDGRIGRCTCTATERAERS